MIPLAVPNLCGNERKYLNKCIDTTFVSSVGEFVNRFEEMCAKVTGAKRGVATSSGTTGLHAALTAVGVRYGDLVIIPSFTFIATANAVAHCGALPWCMDISENDWCLDPVVVRNELIKNTAKRSDGLYHVQSGRRVAAIMPVYTLGNIPDMTEFGKLADEYELPLVVDAACAVGAKHNGIPFGSLADLSVLSFNGNKTITCGGGGMVVGDDEKLLEKVHHLTTTARVGTEYDFDMVGFNYRMTNIQAAVGCAQMENLERFVASKLRVHDFYKKEISNMEPFPLSLGGTAWFSGVQLPKGSDIDDVRRVAAELKEHGIEGRTFWKPVHLQKMYEDCPRSKLDVSESVWGRIVTLPCSTGITDDELHQVAQTMRKICGDGSYR